jgi:hypothetical protein
MVNALTKKPDAFETEQDGDHFYEMHDSAGTYAYACLNFNYAPVAILHLEVVRFGHNVLKKIVSTDWPFCKAQCTEHGCKIISINKPGSLENNQPWTKFVRHFGFKEFAQYTASIQMIGEENG